MNSLDVCYSLMNKYEAGLIRDAVLHEHYGRPEVAGRLWDRVLRYQLERISK